MIDILVELAEKPMDASFNAARQGDMFHFLIYILAYTIYNFSRYFLLQGGINQQEWRTMEVWHKLLTIVQPQLPQPYQNLRDRLGRYMYP